MSTTPRELVMLLHSTGTNPMMWSPVAGLPGAGWLAPSNLGYAPNAPLRRGEVCGASEDVAWLLSQIPDGTEEIHLVGHSYGALLAVLMARKEPRIRSLCLYEPVLFGVLTREGGADPAVAAEVEGFMANPWFLHDEARGGTDEWLEVFIDFWNRPGSWARMPEALKDYSRQHGWKMFQEVRSCFFGVRSYDEVPLPEIPVTLLVGERSPAASRAMTEGLARRHPWAHAVVLPKVGHMGPLTHPSVVAGLVAEHFGRVKAEV